MGRSGYVDGYDCDEWASIRYQGAVKSAFRGKRGQAFLREMLHALDEVANGKLIEGDLIQEDGAVCAIGAVGKARGLDMAGLDPEDIETLAARFGIAEAMAREIVFENDDDFGFQRNETPEARFARMRKWIEERIVSPKPDSP